MVEQGQSFEESHPVCKCVPVTWSYSLFKCIDHSPAWPGGRPSSPPAVGVRNMWNGRVVVSVLWDGLSLIVTHAHTHIYAYILHSLTLSDHSLTHLQDGLRLRALQDAHTHIHIYTHIHTHKYIYVSLTCRMACILGLCRMRSASGLFCSAIVGRKVVVSTIGGMIVSMIIRLCGTESKGCGC